MGLVISHAFNRTGEFQVHLLETGTRAFRFKFVRAVVIPGYIMTLDLKLTASTEIPPPLPLGPGMMAPEGHSPNADPPEDDATEVQDPEDASLQIS